MTFPRSYQADETMKMLWRWFFLRNPQNYLPPATHTSVIGRVLLFTTTMVAMLQFKTSIELERRRWDSDKVEYHKIQPFFLNKCSSGYY